MDSEIRNNNESEFERITKEGETVKICGITVYDLTGYRAFYYTIENLACFFSLRDCCCVTRCRVDMLSVNLWIPQKYQEMMMYVEENVTRRKLQVSCLDRETKLKSNHFYYIMHRIVFEKLTEVQDFSTPLMKLKPKKEGV